jgi:alcohol dehydrogenase, propanol-preferring
MKRGANGMAHDSGASPDHWLQQRATEETMAKATSTYRAVQAVGPGKLELTEKPLLEPPAGHVRIRVEACGVCHSDSATVEGVLPIQWPRVPGHEAVGRIDVIGEGVEGWAVGQRVGVGFLGGGCGHCEYCRDGDLVNCINQGYTGVQHDGGYAEVMIAKSSGLIAVPDDLSSVAAAPLLCAGLTTFSALRNSPARAGDLVAVFGVGGLGHLGVQYARRMGFEVVAIDRGDDRAELSKKLGAHHYIDSSGADIAKALQALGGAQMVLATASGGKAVAAALGGLRRVVGVRSAVQATWCRRRPHGDPRGRRCDAQIQRDERRRCHGRDHAARTGRRGLRPDDVRQSTLQGGSDDGLSDRSCCRFTD